MSWHRLIIWVAPIAAGLAVVVVGKVCEPCVIYIEGTAIAYHVYEAMERLNLVKPAESTNLPPQDLSSATPHFNSGSAIRPFNRFEFPNSGLTGDPLANLKDLALPPQDLTNLYHSPQHPSAPKPNSNFGTAGTGASNSFADLHSNSNGIDRNTAISVCGVVRIWCMKPVALCQKDYDDCVSRAARPEGP
jgi:hypothetical protein